MKKKTVKKPRKVSKKALSNLGNPERRFDYNVCHQNIQAAYMNHFREKKQLATIAQLQERTGYSKNTIQVHLKEINLPNFMTIYKTLTPAVMEGLVAKARSGSAPAAKLWMQIVEGLVEKVESNSTHNFDYDEISSEDQKRIGLSILEDSKIELRKSDE
jgi:hypothetical protein